MAFFKGVISKAAGNEEKKDQTQSSSSRPPENPVRRTEPVAESSSPLAVVEGFAIDMKQAASDKVDRVQAALIEEVNSLKGKLAVAKDEISRMRGEKLEMLKDIDKVAKRSAVNFLASKLTTFFNYVMDKLCVQLKERATNDEYMPGFVKSMIETLVDAIWPDIKSETKEAMLSVIAPDVEIYHGKEPCCRYTPVTILRYTLYPYDRNIWRKIRDPLWWLLILIAMVPVYGITQIYHILLFLVIDKGDEYQLLQYISQFKSLQFLSLGLVGCMIGSIQYYFCTSTNPPNCNEYGPREQLFTLGLFVSQIIVCWTAFLLTFSAAQKGGRYAVMEASAEAEMKARRRQGEEEPTELLMGDMLEEAAFEPDDEIDARCKNRFLFFLIYDFILFLLCSALALWAAFGNLYADDSNVQENEGAYTERNWKFTATLFWIKSFYGLMSFPFVMLKIPLLSSLFAHMKPTGYNWWGNTVPYLGKEEDSTPYRPPRQEVPGEPV